MHASRFDLTFGNYLSKGWESAADGYDHLATSRARIEHFSISMVCSCYEAAPEIAMMESMHACEKVRSHLRQLPDKGWEGTADGCDHRAAGRASSLHPRLDRVAPVPPLPAPVRRRSRPAPQLPQARHYLGLPCNLSPKILAFVGTFGQVRATLHAPEWCKNCGCDMNAPCC